MNILDYFDAFMHFLLILIEVVYYVVYRIQSFLSF